MRSRKAQEFEGNDIMYYLENPDELKRLVDGIVDDELTRGRIRTIYVKARYGQSSINQIAEYYNLPAPVIKDIASGKLFHGITADL